MSRKGIHGQHLWRFSCRHQESHTIIVETELLASCSSLPFECPEHKTQQNTPQALQASWDILGLVPHPMLHSLCFDASTAQAGPNARSVRATGQLVECDLRIGHFHAEVVTEFPRSFAKTTGTPNGGPVGLAADEAGSRATQEHEKSAMARKHIRGHL